MRWPIQLAVSQSPSTLEPPPGATVVTDRRRLRRRFSRRGGGLYLPLAERNAIAIAVALLWAAFAVVIAVPWIVELERALTPPVGIAIVAGIAIVPGYLNAHLVVSLLFDRPPSLAERPVTTLPAITVLIAAYNE